MRFSVVGAVGVAVNTVALYALYRLAGLPLVIAAAVAVEVSIIHNFLWNDRWTFAADGTRGAAWPRFLKFNAVSLGGLGIATGTLWALVTAGIAHYLVANLVGIGLATVWNFGINVVWTWRRPRRREAAPWEEERRAA